MLVEIVKGVARTAGAAGNGGRGRSVRMRALSAATAASCRQVSAGIGRYRCCQRPSTPAR